MDNSFREFIERTVRIHQLTEDEIAQKYLNLLSYFPETNKLPFIIQGNLQWKSKNKDGVYSNGIWLKSGLYDPEGKNISDEPVKNYLQMYLNIYKIEGTIDIVPQNDLENAKTEIIHALNKITILKNTISLLSESSLDWYPAIYTEVEVLDAPSPSKKGRTKLSHLPLFQNLLPTSVSSLAVMGSPAKCWYVLNSFIAFPYLHPSLRPSWYWPKLFD